MGVLGLPVLSSAGLRPPAPGTPTLLNVQHCKGTEASLEGCARRPWGQQECVADSGLLAAVRCIADMSSAAGAHVGVCV